MKSAYLVLLAAVAALGGTLPIRPALSAQAARRTVALVPAAVFKGAPENGPVVTEAFRADLQRHGFEVLPAARVNAALRRLGLNLSKPQFLPGLSRLREATGADFVVYPRVLSVGPGINSDRFQANILVNVAGNSSKSFVHTRQIGQVFRPKTATLEQAAIDPPAAGKAAEELLAGFYSKAGK